MKLENNRFHIPALFSRDFFAAGFTMVPNLLLEFSSRIGLSGNDLLVTLALFYFQQNGITDPDLQDFARISNLSIKQVQSSLEGMEAKGLIILSSGCLDFTGLFQKIVDLWAEKKVQDLQQSRQETAAARVRVPNNRQTPVLKNIINAFEQEFGRPLTPMECSQIIRWNSDDGYSDEMILEALKRAVLRAVFNLNYIDRILNRWSRNNLRTVREVRQYEERLRSRHQSKRAAVQPEDEAGDKEEKYRDLYLNRLGG